MNGNGDKLKGLLNQWRDLEPKAGFEAGVWRQIRRSPRQATETATLTDWFRRVFPWPAVALAAVVMASALVGSAAGILSARSRSVPGSSELEFLGSGTLAGSYARASLRGAE